MGGVTKTFKKITNAVSKPFEQVYKAVAKPLKSIGRGVVGAVTGYDGSQVETSPTVTQTAPAAADVNLAATTPETDTEAVSRRKGLLKSAKGKKSLTVSRASGGGLNV